MPRRSATSTSSSTGSGRSYAFRLNGKQEVSDPQGRLKGRADLIHPW
jgi:hypothetical protein